jgi:hypothetical protein
MKISVLITATIISLEQVGPSNAFERDPNFTYCITLNTVPHFQSFQVVYNEVMNLCGERLNVFYCFPQFSTNEREICGSPGAFVLSLDGYQRVRIGLAPYSFENEPIFIGCLPPTTATYDGNSLVCR